MEAELGQSGVGRVAVGPLELRRRLHLAGVAEAWLEWPSKYPRELKAIEEASMPREEVSAVFDCFPGRVSFKGGLLFLTDRRLVFVRFHWFRPRINSIPYDSIRQARVASLGRERDLVIETNSGKTSRFHRGLGGKKYFFPIFGELQKVLGDRVVGMEQLQPEPVRH